MRFYFNKRLLKVILAAVIAILVLFIVLQLVSVWDRTHSGVDTDALQPSTPSVNTGIDIPDISVRQPTEQEREELADGSLTKEELIEDLVEDAVVTSPEEPQTPKPVQSAYERRLAEITAEVYVLRDAYIAALANMYAEAETALTKKDLTEQEFASIVSSYLSKATELELQCDDQIDAIVAEMEQLIRDNGADPAPVDTLIETYANEKAEKKAWYLKRLEEKGLIS